MVVIIGAGIVGAATAYYLSTTTSSYPITILDAAPGPAAGSSGGAGAFLTNRPPSSRHEDNAKAASSDKKRQALFERSFKLHQQLVKDLQLESFCPVQNYQSIETIGTTTPKATDTVNPPSWLTEDSIVSTTPLQGDATLVDPYELTTALLDKALSMHPDSIFQQANVAGLETDGNCITAIHLENENDDNGSTTISIDQDEPVVIALGPWSCRIEDWLLIPCPMEGVLSTSLIFQDGIPLSDIGTALFCDEDTNGCHLELLGRHDQSLYVSGCGESLVLGTQELRSSQRPCPTTPCPPNMARAAAAQSSLRELGYRTTQKQKQQPQQHGKQPSPDIVQACIRPVSPDGLPVIGKILDNGYVATGGGPWGITWGPVMGQCLASMINDNDDDDPPIRLGSLKPQRFDTLIYRTLLKSRASPDMVQGY